MPVAILRQLDSPSWRDGVAGRQWGVLDLLRHIHSSSARYPPFLVFHWNTSKGGHLQAHLPDPWSACTGVQLYNCWLYVCRCSSVWTLEQLAKSLHRLDWDWGAYDRSYRVQQLPVPAHQILEPWSNRADIWHLGPQVRLSRMRGDRDLSEHILHPAFLRRGKCDYHWYIPRNRQPFCSFHTNQWGVLIAAIVADLYASCSVCVAFECNDYPSKLVLLHQKSKNLTRFLTAQYLAPAHLLLSNSFFVSSPYWHDEFWLERVGQWQ